MIDAMKLIQRRELDALSTNDEKVGGHQAHYRGKEHRERGYNREEGGRDIDELPRHDDPSSDECDDGATADVDVFGEHSSQIDASRDGITADVLKARREREADRKEEHSSARFAASLAVLHHAHEEVGGIPENLAIDFLGRSGDDKSDETNHSAGSKQRRHRTTDISTGSLSITRKVGAVCHTSSLATDG